MCKLLVLVVVLVSSSNLFAKSRADTPPAPAERGDDDISTLKHYFREETLNLREEMYSLLSERQGAALIALQVMDLVREVKDVADSVKKLENKIDVLSAEQEGIISSLAGVKSNLTTKITDVSAQVTNVNTIVSKVEEMVDVMRSEIRLISQHKLTWQNTTWDNKYHPDFAVDGVYTLESEYDGSNPMQKSGQDMNQKGNMLIIDLGGFFKIHTIKLWNRLVSYRSFAVGVLIYADEQLIGSLHDTQSLYNLRVVDNVYARKIYMKQALDQYMNFIEIQVFGSGPYSEE